MEEMLRWMLNPMAVFARGEAFREAHQKLLKAQADMLSAMAEYSLASLELLRVMSQPLNDDKKS
jgi:hypothetical protein